MYSERLYALHINIMLYNCLLLNLPRDRERDLCRVFFPPRVWSKRTQNSRYNFVLIYSYWMSFRENAIHGWQSCLIGKPFMCKCIVPYSIIESKMYFRYASHNYRLQLFSQVKPVEQTARSSNQSVVCSCAVEDFFALIVIFGTNCI